MNSYFKALSLFLLLLVPCAGQAQWVQMPAPSDSTSVAGLVAIGKNLFVTGGESDGSQFGEIGYIFHSIDQGASWNEIDSGLPGFLSGFVVDGSNLFAGRNGIAGTDSSVFFISTNNGTSWQPTSGGSDLKGIEWLYENGGKLLTGTRNDTGLYTIFLSTDTGKSWAYAGSPKIDGALRSFVVMGMNLFIGTEAGVYRSTNNGSSWIAVDNALPFDSTREDFGPVDALVVMDTSIFAGNYNSVFVTTNYDTSWTPANNGLPAKTYVTSFAQSGANIFAGTDRGIFLSTNNGANWTAVNEGLPVTDVNGLLVCDTTLFATTGNFISTLGGVWRRPLSEMIPTSAVSNVPTVSSEIKTYPNPFSQSTTINFSSTESDMAEVTIVNLLGSEVARIFSGELSAGEHSFMWDASGMPQGMYECVVRMNGQVKQVPIIITH